MIGLGLASIVNGIDKEVIDEIHGWILPAAPASASQVCYQPARYHDTTPGSPHSGAFFSPWLRRTR